MEKAVSGYPTFKTIFLKQRKIFLIKTSFSKNSQALSSGVSVFLSVIYAMELKKYTWSHERRLLRIFYVFNTKRVASHKKGNMNSSLNMEGN